MTDKAKLVKRAAAEVAAPAPAPDMQALFKLAVQQGEDGVVALERLTALHERMEDRAAIKQFHAALSRFQNECPPLTKATRVTVRTGSGAGYSYNYADIDDIMRTIRPYLEANDLSVSWDSEDDATTMTAICTVYHSAGHARSSRFRCPVESASRGMSSQHKAKGALSFAMRTALVMALGLTTAEPDTDGRDVSLETITDSQAADLQALADEVKADVGRFLKFLGVESFATIPARDYARATHALERKRGQG